MGSTIYLAELPAEGPVEFHAVTLQQEGLTAEWIQNGEVVAVQQAGEPNEEGKITFSYIPGTREEGWVRLNLRRNGTITVISNRSEEHTSELQSRGHLVCRLQHA